MFFNNYEIWSSIVECVKSPSLVAWCTLFLAIYGVRSWRREFVGKRDTELCEEVLEKFYRAKEVIRLIRSPLVLASELQKKTEHSTSENDRDAAHSFAQLLFDRYNTNQDLFSSIYAMRYRFIARFGKDAGKPFEDFHQAVTDLFLAARRLETLRGRPDNYFKSDKEREDHDHKVDENEDIFWGTGGPDDLYDVKIEKIVQSIDRECRKRITR